MFLALLADAEIGAQRGEVTRPAFHGSSAGGAGIRPQASGPGVCAAHGPFFPSPTVPLGRLECGTARSRLRFLSRAPSGGVAVYTCGASVSLSLIPDARLHAVQRSGVLASCPSPPPRPQREVTQRSRSPPRCLPCEFWVIKPDTGANTPNVTRDSLR